MGADLSLQGSAGKVINISSVGGKYGAPFMGAYSASKHGVEGMSDSLRRELLPYGIDVVVVGMTTFLRGVSKQWSAKSEESQSNGQQSLRLNYTGTDHYVRMVPSREILHL